MFLFKAGEFSKELSNRQGLIYQMRCKSAAKDIKKDLDFFRINAVTNLENGSSRIN